MADTDDSCDLTHQDVAGYFSDPTLNATYPPILSIAQAAALAQVPEQTVYAWSSQGRLKGCRRRVGKHRRILRDRFVQKLFNEGLYGD